MHIFPFSFLTLPDYPNIEPLVLIRHNRQRARLTIFRSVSHLYRAIRVGRLDFHSPVLQKPPDIHRRSVAKLQTLFVFPGHFQRMNVNSSVYVACRAANSNEEIDRPTRLVVPEGNALLPEPLESMRIAPMRQPL
jgi:hypothetical protein